MMSITLEIERIFLFARNKTYSREEAEDLAQEIKLMKDHEINICERIIYSIDLTEQEKEAAADMVKVDIYYQNVVL